MDPDVSNQVTQSFGYYQRQSGGVVYQNLKDEKALEHCYYFGQNDYMFDVRSLSRPIKKVYINFDKDIAHKMFGYRVRFVDADMAMYAKSGTPSSLARQTHKPVHFYQKERIKHVLERYLILQGYHSKQTIVKVLDSDNEEDRAEIEKNQRAIQKMKNGPGNANPKIKKRQKNLTWFYGLDSKWEERPPSAYDGGAKSAQHLKKQRFPHQKRFASNTLRYSHKLANPHAHFGQMLQIQNQASADNAGLPKDAQLDDGASGALLSSFVAPNRNEKLLHTDQKGKPVKTFGPLPGLDGQLDPSQGAVQYDQSQVSVNIAALPRFHQHQQQLRLPAGAPQWPAGVNPSNMSAKQLPSPATPIANMTLDQQLEEQKGHLYHQLQMYHQQASNLSATNNGSSSLQQ